MIRHVSYLDIPAEHRAVSAKKARQQIRNMMTGSFLTPEQGAYLNGRLHLLEAWERGNVQQPKNPNPIPQLYVAPAAPQHHTVELTDGVRVGESVG